MAALIDGQSDEKVVTAGQVYRLPSWSVATVRKDKSIPSDSFGFANQVMAAPLIAIKLVGFAEPAPSKSRPESKCVLLLMLIAMPVFIDHVLPPGSMSIYRPRPQIALWFQRDIETSTMIALSTSAANVVEMEDATQTISYNAKGEWTDEEGIVKLKVDYFKTTPAWVQE